MLPFLPTQLRAFLTVVEQGSLRAAADHLRISPAAVSSSLTALRRAVGVPLFEKDGRGLKLSASGTVFLQDIRRIVALSAGAIASAKAAAQSAPPPVRIGAVLTAGEAFLGTLLADFMARAPDVPVEVEVVRRAVLWDMIAERKVDVGFAELPPTNPMLRVLALRRNEFVLAAGPGRRYTKATLARTLWFIREPGSGTRAVIEAFLRDYGISPPTRSIGSPAVIIACLRQGLGVSLLPRDLIVDDLREGRLQIVRTPFTPRARPWHFITAADQPMSADTRRLLDFTLSTGLFVPAE